RARVGAPGAATRPVDRSRHQRPDASAVRMDFRSPRARKHDARRVRTRRRRDDDVAADAAEPDVVRVAVGCGVLWMGRDLLAVPVDAHRYVWNEARDSELRMSV